MVKEWEHYVAPGGRDKLADDLEKLNLRRYEKIAIRDHMSACARGELDFPTIKPLPGLGVKNLWEIRVLLDDRSFRVVYANLPGGLKLLGLHVFAKQAQRERRHLNVAVKRYKEWLQ